MKARLFLVEAIPGPKLVELPGQARPAGYYQRFGVTAASEPEMIAMIRQYLKDDLESTLVSFEGQGAPDLDGEDAEIRPFVGDLSNPGFWYVGGRAFFQQPTSSKPRNINLQ